MLNKILFRGGHLVKRMEDLPVTMATLPCNLEPWEDMVMVNAER